MSGYDSINTVQTDTMGKDAFLKMLVTQLKNQDPLNPMDGADFTAQLAQFSSLEQLQNVNTQLEFLSLYQVSLNNAQSVNLLGKDVTAKGDIVKVEGVPVDLTYDLSADARKVTIDIYNESGDLVETLESNNQKEGKNSVTWDCSGVAHGNYTFEVTAIDANENVIPAYTIMTGRVTGVTFKEGTPYLFVNGREIAFGNIISVNEPEG